MLGKRIFATAALLTHLAMLIVVSGPFRWELAHTYEHMIMGAEGYLPVLTNIIALPILGIGSHDLLIGVAVSLIWCVLWLPAFVLLFGVWRIQLERKLDDWLLYGGMLYVSISFLIFIVIILSLVLPFALL